jgi:hypothetical protein
MHYKKVVSTNELLLSLEFLLLINGKNNYLFDRSSSSTTLVYLPINLVHHWHFERCQLILIFVCDYFHVDFVIGIFFDKFSVMQNGFLKALFSKAHNISVASIFESSTVINCPFYDGLSSFDFQRCSLQWNN